jgi:hypothetical protein
LGQSDEPATWRSQMMLFRRTTVGTTAEVGDLSIRGWLGWRSCLCLDSRPSWGRIVHGLAFTDGRDVPIAGSVQSAARPWLDWFFRGMLFRGVGCRTQLTRKATGAPDDGRRLSATRLVDSSNLARSVVDWAGAARMTVDVGLDGGNAKTWSASHWRPSRGTLIWRLIAPRPCVTSSSRTCPVDV